MKLSRLSTFSSRILPATLLTLLVAGCGGLQMGGSEESAQLLDQVVTEDNAAALAEQARNELSYDEFRLVVAYKERVHPHLPEGQLPSGLSLRTMIESQKDYERGLQGREGQSAAGQSAESAPTPSTVQPSAAPPTRSADTRPAPPPSPPPTPAAPQQPAPAPQQAAARPEPAPPAPRTIVVADGTPLKIRLTQAVSSKTNQDGDSFEAQLDEDLVVDGVVTAPEGSRVVGRLSNVAASGKVKGRATMAITLSRIHVGEEVYALRTNTLRFEAEGSGKEDAKKIGIGSGIGAVIGAIAGGGKGAAIGAAIGAGAGTGAVLATSGDEVEFRVEQLFEFRLEQDLEMPVVGY